ncbi:hypothetical protein HNY73_016543 [Argiope bruennichi]|uniref:Uncharacterized protein n=1 Tax=Argiope bruennichi TaxID=94029 RepID=A0A8T0EJ45_ARGBR|nr:hypothetical protein HNY73_016543 [Argiope bruennichi]
MKREPLINVSGLLLFVEEAIDYIFTFRDIDKWSPPASIKVLKATFPKEVYFHPYIGLAINHQCAVDDSMRYAEEDGFNIDTWLQLPCNKVREQTQNFLEVVGNKTRPVNLRIIHMLAFAGLLCRLSMQNKKEEFINIIIWRVVHVFGRRFPLEWIYFDARQWAMAYNVRHFEIHTQLMENDPFQESKPSVRGWIPLYDLPSLRADNPNKRYFSSDIGWAVCHHCAMDDAWLLATHGGFDLNKWLELTSDESKDYMNRFLGLVIDKTKPANVSIINGLVDSQKSYRE